MVTLDEILLKSYTKPKGLNTSNHLRVLNLATTLTSPSRHTEENSIRLVRFGKTLAPNHRVLTKLPQKPPPTVAPSKPISKSKSSLIKVNHFQRAQQLVEHCATF